MWLWQTKFDLTSANAVTSIISLFYNFGCAEKVSNIELLKALTNNSLFVKQIPLIWLGAYKNLFDYDDENGARTPLKWMIAKIISIYNAYLFWWER